MKRESGIIPLYFVKLRYNLAAIFAGYNARLRSSSSQQASFISVFLFYDNIWQQFRSYIEQNEQL